MSYENIFYLGHFEFDRGFAVVEGAKSSPLAVPKVKEAVDECFMLQHATSFCDGSEGCHNDWDMKIAYGMLVFAEFSTTIALQWALDLSKEMGLDIVDGTMRMVPLGELRGMIGAS